MRIAIFFFGLFSVLIFLDGKCLGAMNKKAIKWTLMLVFFIGTLGTIYMMACPSDPGRPWMIGLVSLFAINWSINYFLGLPMHVPHLPHLANVAHRRERQFVVLLTWIIVLTLFLWGVIDGFGCT